MKHITPILVFVLLSIGAKSQTITLDQCQQLARQNYPLIQQYDLIRRTTDLNLSNIAKGWLPQISAVAQGSWQSDVPTLPSPLRKMLAQQGVDSKGMKKDLYRVGIDIDQTIYDGGLISGRKKVTRLEGDVRSAQTTTDLYAIRRQVNELYFSILLLDEKIRLNKDLQALLRSNLRKLQSMLSHGTAMQSDVNSVMAEKLLAEQSATELAHSRKSFVDMLVVFVGKGFTDLAMPEDIIVNTADNRRPELQLFNTQSQLIKAREDLLKARLLPRLSLFAQGSYGYPGYDQFDAMVHHRWKQNTMVGARVSWNIGALYTNKNDRARLQTDRRFVETARQTFLFNNRLQEIQHSDGITKYRQMLANDHKIVILRSDNRRAAESKLQHGIIDTDNLLQEITRENRSRIDLSTHTIMMLKETYDLKYTTNN